MASQFASGKIPTLTRKLNAGDSTAYMDSDVGVTSGRLYGNNNLQEEWIGFTGVAASGSEFAYSGLTRGLSQTADPSTASTGFTWLAGQQFALVEMHDQMMNKQKPEPVIFASTAARDSALGADGAATSPWVNVYVSATGLHYNYSLGTNQWEEISTGTVTPNASTTAAGKVEIATAAEVTAGTTTGGTGAILAVSPDQLIQEINGSTAKTTAVDADKLVLADSADSGKRKAITWAQSKTQLLTDLSATNAEFVAATSTTKFTTPLTAGQKVQAPTVAATGGFVNTVIGAALTERSSAATSYTKVKEMVAGFTGTHRITFEMKESGSGYNPKASIYKNGVAFGTEQSSTGNTYVEKVEDLSFTAGDLIQLYIKIDSGATVYAKNLTAKVCIVPNAFFCATNTD